MTNRFHGARTASTLAGSLVLAVTFLPAISFAETLLRMDHYDLDKLDIEGFQLTRKAKIEIEAVGARPRWGDGFSSYAWLLNSATREVVWSQDESGSSRVEDSSILRRTKDSVDLEPGRYELYSWAGSNWGTHGIRIHFADWNDFSRSVKGSKHKDHDDQDWDSDDDHSSRELRRAAQDSWVELRSGDVGKDDLQRFVPNGDWPGAIYQATKLGDRAYLHTSITVDRPVDLRIYALCEFPRLWGDVCDGGWIVNAATRERVWEIRRRDTQPAGGSEKNRVYDDEVHLERGNYVLYFGTDDSHSWDEWNASPPYDPMHWGVTLLPGKNFDASAVHVSENYQRGEPLLAMTKVRDQEDLERSFHLSREGEIEVLAVGEFDEHSDEFADYGWISKPGEPEAVWEMTRRNTEHAGGAEKNRMFDGPVKLPAGDYVLHYETDDSHSYRDWNADRPFEPEAWGVSLYPGPGMSAADFKVGPETNGEPVRSANTLVSLVKVGDNERVHDTFKLDRPTRVHIYALGEGDRGEMYDFGYIEKRDSGETVWEMTYRNTKSAGGARKNRMFDQDIQLDAGTYEVRYETDGSHSYPDWNASRPRDPRSWGITITLAESKK